jgi:hypothetical protein
MLKLLKYYPVNWVDGMKLNRDHFIQSEQATTDLIRDAINITTKSWNFGILPGLQGPGSGLSFQIDVDKNSLLRVRLDHCRAVTLAGSRIEIVNIPGQNLHASIGEVLTEYNFINSNGKNLFVVVSVNPFERDYFGEPDPSEHPPRYPLTKPTYQLSIVPQEQFLEVGPFHVPVAKLSVQGNAVSVIQNYIPPCVSMDANVTLNALYDEIDNFFSRLESAVNLIIQKIYQKNQKKDLAEMALYVCEKVIAQLGATVHGYRWMCREVAPVQCFAEVAAIARVMKNTLEARSGSGREQFITYLTDWDEFGLQQGEFEALLNDVVLMDYDHLNISESSQRIQKFIAIIVKVFEKLAKLDYIGKREDPGIIVATRTAAEAVNKSSGSRGGSIWLE